MEDQTNRSSLNLVRSNLYFIFGLFVSVVNGGGKWVKLVEVGRSGFCFCKVGCEWVKRLNMG